MSSDSVKETLFEIERLIFQGKIREASNHLKTSKLSPNTRKETLLLARVLRRLGQPDDSLRLLNAVVRPKANLLTPATDEEIAEYAVCLQRVGSLKEAWTTLNSVRVENVKEVQLYQAVFLFSEWNYLQGIPLLENYLKQADPSHYNTRLAKLNLAAALVHEKLPGAEQVLEALRNETLECKEYLLLGNAFEISAQLAIQKEDFTKAEQLIEQAETLLSGVKVLDFLWLVKWKNIALALKTRDSKYLDLVESEALRKRHWETLRDLDFYRLKIEFDRTVFNKLYYGTKSPFFRKRLLQEFPRENISLSVGVGANWHFIESKTASLSLMDGFENELSTGTLQHALLVHFFSDAYKGYRTGELYSILFPNQYYSPGSSQNRVHQMVSRFRKNLNDQCPGLDVDADNFTYRLDWKDPDKVPVVDRPAEMPDPSPLNIKYFKFDREFKSDLFVAEDIQEILGLSRSTAGKLVNEWVSANIVVLVRDSRPKLFKKLFKE